MNRWLVPSEARVRRARLNLKVIDIAAQLGVSPTTVSTWINGSRELTPERQVQMAAILGGSKRALFTDTAPNQGK